MCLSERGSCRSEVVEYLCFDDGSFEYFLLARIFDSTVVTCRVSYFNEVCHTGRCVRRNATPNSTMKLKLDPAAPSATALSRQPQVHLVVVFGPREILEFSRLLGSSRDARITREATSTTRSGSDMNGNFIDRSFFSIRSCLAARRHSESQPEIIFLDHKAL